MSSNEQPNFQGQRFCELFGDMPGVDIIRQAAEQDILTSAHAASLGSYGTCEPCDGPMFVNAGSEIRLPKGCPNRPTVQEYAGRVLFPSVVIDTRRVTIRPQ